LPQSARKVIPPKPHHLPGSPNPSFLPNFRESKHGFVFLPIIGKKNFERAFLLSILVLLKMEGEYFQILLVIRCEAFNFLKS
jgi:hypothetical protein